MPGYVYDFNNRCAADDEYREENRYIAASENALYRICR